MKLRIFSKIFYTLILVFFCVLIKAQDSIKSVKSERISKPIKIDGILNEVEWSSVSAAKDFVEMEPDNGQPEKTNSSTLVKVLYDDTSIYFGIELYDSKMDTLNTTLTERDQINNSDWFLVGVNPLGDKQQYFEFLVSAAGVQGDAFASSDSGEDWNWDAIWESKVTIHKDKWILELKIPYSAMRFPKEKTSNWEVNFIRNFSKNRKKFSWAHIDNSKGSFFQYTGKIEGINNISPPTRLFFIPYTSYYFNTSDGEITHSLKGGLDVKWGVSDNFTLDAILIPDFGQTSFDNVQFVLGPFEQQFSDRRPFFTEGTELFSKGNLFYSRRIGNAPSGSVNLTENENIENYPSTVNLLNALKISGRTKDGWGIGVLNAITDVTKVQIENNLTGEIRKEVVEPLANYNISVIDKRFNKNSSISFTNASTIRNESFRDANVSSLSFDIFDKENKYNTFGRVNYSFVNDVEDKQGISTNVNWRKSYGKNRYGGGFSFVSKNYDPNDLGINFNTDYWSFNLTHNYRILKSTEKFNSLNYNHNINTRINNTTQKLEQASYSFNFNSNNKKNTYNGFGFGIQPFTTYDFYEPRVDGRYSERPKSYSLNYFHSPDYNKKFLVDIGPSIFVNSFRKNWGYSLNLTPIYTISDKIRIRTQLSINQQFYNRGYVTETSDNIIYGARNRNTITTTLGANYYFNPNMSMHLNFRHYWTNVDYKEFFNLNADGSYQENNTYDENANFTFNSWNIDTRFSWRFAPGSQMDIVYTQSISSYEEIARNSIGDNLNVLFNEPFTHIFSIRLSYNLDYNKIKSWISS